MFEGCRTKTDHKSSHGTYGLGVLKIKITVGSQDRDWQTNVNTILFWPYSSAANCPRVANLVPCENIEPSFWLFFSAQNLYD